MLKPQRTGADRALPAVSVGLGIAACAAMAFSFFVPLLGVFFGSGHMPFVLVTAGGIFFFASPTFGIAAVVCGHVARRLNPRDNLARIGLILGYSALGLSVVLLGGAAITWLTIASIR